MSTSATKRVSILTGPVDRIRPLTSTELRNLRREGVSCGSAWFVTPNGGGLCGYLYRPAPRGTGCWGVNANILTLAA